MVQSLNKKVDLTINATSYLGMANYGKVLVGDEAFEYYNDKNVNDYIQIPWSSLSCKVGELHSTHSDKRTLVLLL